MPQEFTHFADRVHTMLDEGDSLAAIAERVDSWPLPAEERSALWLFAWSSGAPRRPGAASSAGALSRSSRRRVDHRRSM